MNGSEHVHECVGSWTDDGVWQVSPGDPIVRCKDCKHYSEHEWIIATDVSDVCHFWHGGPTKVEPDGFCAWGKRKEDGDDTD